MDMIMEYNEQPLIGSWIREKKDSYSYWTIGKSKMQTPKISYQ